MSRLPFTKKNYLLMVVGLIVIAIGFLCMAYDTSTFGMIGITISPLVVMGGFVIEFFAILHHPKQNENKK